MPEGQEKSRWARWVSENGTVPPLPELPAGEYLLNALHEAGAYTQTTGGIVPLTWQELQAYIELTGELGEDWENRLVMEMSREYVDGFNIGLDPAATPPFGTAVSGPVVADGFFASLEAARKND